jgi:toxin ParE1/3/4
LAILRLSPLAKADILAILARTDEIFGEAARLRYEALIAASLRHIANDPLLAGSLARPEIGEGIRTYHLRHSRRKGSGSVRKPRHFLLYRFLHENVIGIGRILHDAMEIDLHLPPAYGDEG